MHLEAAYNLHNSNSTKKHSTLDAYITKRKLEVPYFPYYQTKYTS